MEKCFGNYKYGNMKCKECDDAAECNYSTAQNVEIKNEYKSEKVEGVTNEIP